MTTLSRSALALSAILFVNSFAVAQQATSAKKATSAAPVDLGTLGGTSSQANAVNLEGVVVGSSTLSGDTVTHAFLAFSGKAPIDLGTLPGGTNSSATAVNLLDFVTGTSDFNDPINGGVQHAFLYANGTLSDLGSLGGGISQGNGIDAEGIVVGSSLTSDGSSTHAFWYNPSTRQLNDLGTLSGGANSAAYGINLFGQIVGNSDTGRFDNSGNPITDAVMWNLLTRKVVDLGTLPGGAFAQATAINNFGSTVGFSSNAQGLTHAFLAKPTGLLDLGALGGSYSQATAINDLGVVVGFSNISGDTDVHAFVWTPQHGLADLNTLLPANSGWVLSAAYGINLEGKIVGVGTHNGASHAFAFDLCY